MSEDEGVTTEERAALHATIEAEQAIPAGSALVMNSAGKASALPARVTPSAMITFAMAQQGTSVEHLRDMWALQLEYDAHQAKKAFTAAMARFKSTCPPVINKDATVDFAAGKGRTHYKHATLGGILQVITPHLSANGLSVSWEPSQGERGTVTITCVVTHEDGHSERRTMHGPRDASGNKNPLQEVGSTATYLQRYTLTAALGLSTGELDDDGRGGRQEPDPEPQPKGQRPRPQHRDEPWNPKPKDEPAPKPEPKASRADQCLAMFTSLQGCSVIKPDLESLAGRAMEDWKDGDIDGLIPHYVGLKATPIEERGAKVKALFNLEPGAEG